MDIGGPVNPSGERVKMLRVGPTGSPDCYGLRQSAIHGCGGAFLSGRAVPTSGPILATFACSPRPTSAPRTSADRVGPLNVVFVRRRNRAIRR